MQETCTWCLPSGQCHISHPLYASRKYWPAFFLRLLSQALLTAREIIWSKVAGTENLMSLAGTLSQRALVPWVLRGLPRSFRKGKVRKIGSSLGCSFRSHLYVPLHCRISSYRQHILVFVYFVCFLKGISKSLACIIQKYCRKQNCPKE